MSKSENILRETLLELGRGFEVSQCIFATAELKLMDLLAAGAKSCEELAAATQTDRDALHRLLTVLTGLDMLTETPAGQFEITAMGALLRSDVPGSLRDFMLMRAEQDYTVWGGLLYSLRSGKGAFENMFGMSRYDYFKQHPEAGKRFDRAMRGLSKQHTAAILAAYDFSDIKTLMDVGGGEGDLLDALLTRYPDLQGILFEQQNATLEAAREVMSEKGVVARCQFVEGDFFADIPAGADMYTLKHILHNWDDTRAGQILRNCRQAMGENGRLLIFEPLNTPESSLKIRLLDLRMLVAMSAGYKRTEAQFRQLLQTAGFTLANITPTRLELHIIEAIPC